MNPFRLVWSPGAVLAGWASAAPAPRQIWTRILFPLACLAVVCLVIGRAGTGFEQAGIVWRMSIWQALVTSVLDILFGLLALWGLARLARTLTRDCAGPSAEVVALVCGVPMLLACLLLIHPGLGYFASAFGMLGAGWIWITAARMAETGSDSGTLQRLPAQTAPLLAAVAVIFWLLAREAARFTAALVS